MTRDIRGMTAELIRDASSLVFLELCEVLRADGQIEAAKKVALTGLRRHPELADAHDLYARILVSDDDPEKARSWWERTLELDPRHLGAHKGLGSLFYSDGDLDMALDHLELAVAADPTDQGAIQALQAVRATAKTLAERPVQSAVTETDHEVVSAQDEETVGVFAGLETGDHGILLVDQSGRLLAGRIGTPEGGDGSEAAAAHLVGVSHEAERTARMLRMGEWESLVVEAADGNVHLTRPAEDALLFVVRDRGVPTGRLGLLAASAGVRAKAWLEEQRA